MLRDLTLKSLEGEETNHSSIALPASLDYRLSKATLTASDCRVIQGALQQRYLQGYPDSRLGFWITSEAKRGHFKLSMET